MSLSLTKTPANILANVGDNVTFNLNLSNTTTTNITTPVTLTDILPNELTLVSFTPNGGSIVGSSSTSFPSIAVVSYPAFPGLATSMYQLIAMVNSRPPSGVITNTAVAAIIQPFPTPPTLTPATSTVTVAEEMANITISKSASSSTVQAGSQVTFTIIVNNMLSTSITGATVTDILPPGTTFVSASSSTGAPFTVNSSTNTVTFSPVTYKPATNTFTIVATVNSDVTPGTMLTNTATATDPTTGSTVTASITITVTSSFGLVLSKVGPECVEVCKPIVYIITLTNNGPSDATNVILNEFVSAAFCKSKNDDKEHKEHKDHKEHKEHRSDDREFSISDKQCKFIKLKECNKEYDKSKNKGCGKSKGSGCGKSKGSGCGKSKGSECGKSSCRDCHNKSSCRDCSELLLPLLVQISGPVFFISALSASIPVFPNGATAVFHVRVIAPSKPGCVINNVTVSAMPTSSSTESANAQFVTRVVKHELKRKEKSKCRED